MTAVPLAGLALGAACLTLLVLLPLRSASRAAYPARAPRGSGLAFHDAQLAELARERADGRLAPAEYDQAVLEVQRRILAAPADGATGGRPRRDGATPVWLAMALVPLAAVGLYLVGGTPGLPPMPLAPRLAAADARAADDAALVATLRRDVAALDPRTRRAGQGWLLLGRIAASRRDKAEMAHDWRMALQSGFDPTLAAEAAEAGTEAAGGVTAPDADLFRRALAAFPDAPWRPMALRRLAEFDGGGSTKK